MEESVSVLQNGRCILVVFYADENIQFYLFKKLLNIFSVLSTNVIIINTKIVTLHYSSYTSFWSNTSDVFPHFYSMKIKLKLLD